MAARPFPTGIIRNNSFRKRGTTTNLRIWRCSLASETRNNPFIAARKRLPTAHNKHSPEPFFYYTYPAPIKAFFRIPPPLPSLLRSNESRSRQRFRRWFARSLAIFLPCRALICDSMKFDRREVCKGNFYRAFNRATE